MLLDRLSNVSLGIRITLRILLTPLPYCPPAAMLHLCMRRYRLRLLQILGHVSYFRCVLNALRDDAGAGQNNDICCRAFTASTAPYYFDLERIGYTIGSTMISSPFM